MFYNEAVPGWS